MLEFIRRLSPYFKDYPGRLALAVVGGVVSAAANAGVYYLVKPILDGVFVGQDPRMLRILPPAIVALFFFVGAGRYLQVYELSWVGEDIVRRLRDRLLDHVVRFDLAFFNRFRGGELISRVTNDITRVRHAVSQHVAVLARESLVVVGLVAVAISMSPRLALWGLVILPLAAWPLTVLARRFKHLSHRSQEKDSDITSRLSEIFNNMEIIKAHSSEEFEASRFRRDNLEFRRINMKGVRTREMTNPLMEFLGAIAAALVIWFGGRLIIEGQIKPGEFGAFAAAMFGLYTPLKRMSYVYNQMFEAVAAADRIFDMLGRQPAIRSGSQRLHGPVESIEFDDVRLRYDGAEDEALRGVTFSVRAGETIALVGDSGGGKTSVVNLVLRLYDPTSGSVRINGTDSRELDIGDLRSRIGIVTQRVYVFNDTVAANVAYGAELDPERVETALRRANAWEYVSALPDGIDTVLDEFGANLSGGQRQRLAIARAIYADPEVLILDEATSALDNRSEAAIQRALADVIRGRIAIVIAHRMSTVDLAGTILVVCGGRVVCQGTREQLVATCPEYRRITLSRETEKTDAAAKTAGGAEV